MRREVEVVVVVRKEDGEHKEYEIIYCGFRTPISVVVEAPNWWLWMLDFFF